MNSRLAIVKATAAMINVLQRIFKLAIHVEGLDNITDRPTLFVVNHFTRVETFIVPYILYKHTDRKIRSLANPELFKGVFGEYLARVGAHSTREPLRNRLIVGDLVSGRHDWVIYPEGVMVKSKTVYENDIRDNRNQSGSSVLYRRARVEVRFHEGWRFSSRPLSLRADNPATRRQAGASHPAQRPRQDHH